LFAGKPLLPLVGILRSMNEPAHQAPPKSGCKRTCCMFLLALLLAIGAAAIYAGSAVQQMKATEPLKFALQKESPVAEALLAGKFKILELPGRVLGEDAEVSLDETELNVLLFSQAGHTEDEKARVEIEGDDLWVKVSRLNDDGKTYMNLRLKVNLELPKGEPPRLSLIDGYMGEFRLGPVSRPIAEKLLQKGVQKALAENEQLHTPVGIEVKEGRIHLRYKPQ
jgi:hypothetical protein